MKIAKDTVTEVKYHLHAQSANKERKHIESTESAHPFKFLFGGGNIIAGFEKKLAGLQAGDKFDFVISPSDAYGEAKKEAVVKFPLDFFKIDGVVDFKSLGTGNILGLTDDQGIEMSAKVISHDKESVILDFNHPLAGHTLHFSGEVLSVRMATPEEIAHGHVH